MNYIGITLGIIALLAYVWKAAADYTTLKNTQDNGVTKLALAKMEARLIKLLTDEYTTKDEHEKLWSFYRDLRKEIRGEKDGRHDSGEGRSKV